MTMLRHALAASAGCLALLAAAPAFAQLAKAPCPAGAVPSIVRINTIKAGGSAAGFQEAVRDHLKWYRDHGYTANEIVAYPALETKDNGATWTPSSTQFLSIHKNDPSVPRDKMDDAWRAYVAKYRANSDIASETAVCLPK